MNNEAIEIVMLNVINEALDRGPGFAQQGHVLRTTWERLNSPQELQIQQRILDVWQQLLRDGRVVWGYDIANLSAPFFHLPVVQD